MLRAEGYTERAIFVIDKQGIIRYIDIHEFDHQPDNEEVRKVLRRIDPEAAAKSQAETLPDEELPHGGIVLYCTSWCPKCRNARSTRVRSSFNSEKVNISGNTQASAQLEEWTGGYRTTPTFDINGTIIIDYDEDKLFEVLEDRLKFQTDHAG